MSGRYTQLAGLLAGLVTLGLVGYLVGFTDIVGTLRTLEPGQVLSLVGLGLVPLGLWGLALWLALDTVEASTSPLRGTLLLCVSLFCNSVTPFGRTGGLPLGSGVIAHAVRTPYERALAALGSLSALNTLGTLCLWVPGGVYAVTADGTTGARGTAVATGVGFAGALLAVVAGWHRRDQVTDRLPAVLATLLAAVARPFGWSPPSPAAIAARVDGFVTAVERLAASPRRFAGVFGLAVAGQLTVVLVLYLALEFLWDPPFALVLFVVPLSRTAAAVPTPGGIGSTEALLTGLLVTVGDATPAVAGAAAVLYRVTAFWIPALFGGVAAAGLLLGSRR
jgi:uncharacterized membrane protein YbhN (UPF0104 family)